MSIKELIQIPEKGRLFLMILEAVPTMVDQLIHYGETNIIIQWDRRGVKKE